MPPDSSAVKGLRFARGLSWIVYAMFIAAVVVLVLAFFLLLFNASTDASFTQWVYRSAERVLQPFRGIFPAASLGDRGSIIDFAILFAIVMYGVFALVVDAVVRWLDGRIREQRWQAALEDRASLATGHGNDEVA